MAGTASPRSEPPAGGAGRRAALARFLAAASGARACEITGLAPLSGGAIQENWGLDARFSGGMLAGEQRLVLRTAGATGVPSSLDRLQEFAVLKAAFAAGVTVPGAALRQRRPRGLRQAVLYHAPGIGRSPPRIASPATRRSIRCCREIAEQLGRELARIHTIRPPRADLDFLRSYEASGPARQIAGFRAYLDTHPAPRPVLEWGLRWLETHLPAPAEPVLCHHDFRTGNYLLDGSEADRNPRLGICRLGRPARGYRLVLQQGLALCPARPRGRRHRRPRAVLSWLRKRERPAVDPQRAHFWEVLASVRWAVIALQQSDRHLLGGERSLDLALTGRRAGECELEILMLLDPGGAPGNA